MPERVIYSKAPITEALIDLRVVHAEDFSVGDFKVMGEEIANLYPIQEPMYFQSGQISFQEPGDPAQVETSQGHGGFSFTSQNKQHVLQARMDGFTFSTLAPYDRWESFRDEAYRLWELYRPAAKAESVTRTALRYINRIDIPKAGTVQLEEYLRTYPEISADMPQEGLIGHFFMQIQSWQEDLNCMLVINETPAPSPSEGSTSIRLDLDLFREQFAEPWRADDDEAIWGFLEDLHDRKNEVFEASITNETRRLIR